jgi:hypothetical protein
MPETEPASPSVQASPSAEYQDQSTVRHYLDAECHDRIDNVVIVFLQGLNGLLATDVGLGHDEFDVLVLEVGCVDLLSVVIVLFLLGIMVMVVMMMVTLAVAVARVVVVVSSAAC